MPALHLISGTAAIGIDPLERDPAAEPALLCRCVTSPVSSIIASILPKMSGTSEFAPFFDDNRRRRMLRSVFQAYHAPSPTVGVVFDTNRTWTARAPLLHDLYPGARIICMVREVGWIIDSLERVFSRNPLQISRTLNFQTDSTVYSRADALMNAETGLVGLAWSSLREAWFGENAGSLIVIQYERFVRDPHGVIERLYKELKEAPFRHDFNNIAFDEPDYDATLGMPGLHQIRPKVANMERAPCIPPEIFETLAESNFWKGAEMNRRGITIL